VKVLGLASLSSASGEQDEIVTLSGSSDPSCGTSTCSISAEHDNRRLPGAAKDEGGIMLERSSAGLPEASAEVGSGWKMEVQHSPDK
jgi:hypothetical protein